MAALGDIATIGHLLKRAYTLMEDCRSAPEEIYLTRDHIHAMTLCLEGVVSDLYKNPRSFMHQTTASALTRQHGLKVQIDTCDRALQRAEALLKKFLGFKAQHIRLWQRFKWTTEGKKEMADCKEHLVMATIGLDIFLGKESLNVLWRMESMLEKFMKHMGAFEVHDHQPSGSTPRPRRGSNIGRTLIVSLVFARLKNILASYRRRKMVPTRSPRPQVGGRRPKQITRTPSGFRHNPQRNALMQSYASNMMTETPPPPYTPHDVSRRPPSPDFYYYSDGPNSLVPGLVHCSSSTQRLVDLLKAKPITPAPQEHFECWIIKSGSLAFGPKIAPVYIAHQRGQMQLRKMVEVFREAGRYDQRAVTEGDKRVRLLLKERNKKGKGGKWYLAAGRLLARDPGRTGIVTVDKVVVVLVRRGP